MLHGIGYALSSCLVYSTAATSCEETELKKTLGYIEFAWCKILLLYRLRNSFRANICSCFVLYRRLFSTFLFCRIFDDCLYIFYI